MGNNSTKYFSTHTSVYNAHLLANYLYFLHSSLKSFGVKQPPIILWDVYIYKRDVDGAAEVSDLSALTSLFCERKEKKVYVEC